MEGVQLLSGTHDGGTEKIHTYSTYDQNDKRSLEES